MFGLEPVLLARVRQMAMPPLYERLADIPEIFLNLFENALFRHGLTPAPILNHLCVRHFETLMLNGLRSDNVRGLIDTADRIATRVVRGREPGQAMDEVFVEKFGTRKKTLWSRVNEKVESLAPPKPDLQIAVEALYRSHHGNVTAIERVLRR